MRLLPLVFVTAVALVIWYFIVQIAGTIIAGL